MLNHTLNMEKLRARPSLKRVLEDEITPPAALTFRKKRFGMPKLPALMINTLNGPVTQKAADTRPSIYAQTFMRTTANRTAVDASLMTSCQELSPEQEAAAPVAPRHARFASDLNELRG